MAPPEHLLLAVRGHGGEVVAAAVAAALLQPPTPQKVQRAGSVVPGNVRLLLLPLLAVEAGVMPLLLLHLVLQGLLAPSPWWIGLGHPRMRW